MMRTGRFLGLAAIAVLGMAVAHADDVKYRGAFRGVYGVGEGPRERAAASVEAVVNDAHHAALRVEIEGKLVKRDLQGDGEAIYDKDGRIVGIRASLVGDNGGHFATDIRIEGRRAELVISGDDQSEFKGLGLWLRERGRKRLLGLAADLDGYYARGPMTLARKEHIVLAAKLNENNLAAIEMQLSGAVKRSVIGTGQAAFDDQGRLTTITAELRDNEHRIWKATMKFDPSTMSLRMMDGEYETVGADNGKWIGEYGR